MVIVDDLYIENSTDYTNDIFDVIYDSVVNFNTWLKEHDPLQFPCVGAQKADQIAYKVQNKVIEHPNGTKEVVKSEHFDNISDLTTKIANDGYECSKKYAKSKDLNCG